MGKKTNLDMLLWGIKHIAENHGFKASTDYEEEGQVCICQPPTAEAEGLRELKALVDQTW